MPWSFKDRLDSRGLNVVRKWLDSLPSKARSKIDQRLRNLAVAERLEEPFLTKLKGYKAVYEVRVKCHGVEYRRLGGYGPLKGEFTLVLGATEKNNRIEPTGAFDSAENWLDDLANKRCRVADHEYDTE